MSYPWFFGVITPETAKSILLCNSLVGAILLRNCLVGALPHLHYVIRSSPLCGVRVLHPAQHDLTR